MKYIIDRKPDSITHFSYKVYKSDLREGYICPDYLTNLGDNFSFTF